MFGGGVGAGGSSFGFEGGLDGGGSSFGLGAVCGTPRISRTS